jgi:hypothetical protein
MLTLLSIGAIPDAGLPAAKATSAALASLPVPPENGEMGFVITHFAPLVYNGKDDCPDGPAGTLRENYVATLPPAERSRLLEKSNERELTDRWKAYALGPNGTNICSQPQMFDRPSQKLLRGKVAYGMNLDGDSVDGSRNSNGCTHENFTSPAGERGIDNQAWRAMGCWLTWRGLDGNGGESVHGSTANFANGIDIQVILLRGVDSWIRDDQVEVIYANTDDPPLRDAQGKFSHNASFTVTKIPQLRNVLRGRIENGVLTTDPADILLKQTWGQSAARDLRGARSRWDLRRARLQLTFLPDGSLKAMVAGYQPFWNLIAAQSIGGVGAATTGGIDCAGQYVALRAMADGDRDPKTGQCTTISSALEATAVPAFVNDRPPGRVISATTRPFGQQASRK